MYKTLLRDYESRQKELLLENAELRIVLKQMKKEMVGILSSRKPNVNGDKQDNGAQEVGRTQSTDRIQCSLTIYGAFRGFNSIRVQSTVMPSHVGKESYRQLYTCTQTDCYPSRSHF